MAGPGGIQGIGAAAGSFAEGYRQARAQKNQEAQVAHQEEAGHVDRLFKMYDMVDDPVMKETLAKSAQDAMNNLYSDKKQATKPGIGSQIMQMFGLGKKPAAASTAGPNSQQNIDAGAAQKTPAGAPPAISPDSNTYGSLDGMFGDQLKQPAVPASPMQASGPSPALPTVPDIGAPKPMADAPAPVVTSTLGAPIAERFHMAQSAQAPGTSVPSTAAHPKGFTFTPPPQGTLGADSALPTAQELKMKYLAPRSQGGTSGESGLRTQRSVQQANDLATYEAGQVAKHSLDAVEQVLQEHPDVRTLGQADRDPTFGPEFRHVMDAVQSYEAEGLLPKGYTENWQKQRFDDVRFGAEKYDTRRTVTGADGQTYQHNPVTDKYDIAIGSPSMESRLNDIYSRPKEMWSNEEMQIVNGHLDRLKEQEAAGHPLTADQQAVNDLRSRAALERDPNGQAHQALAAFTKANTPVPAMTPVPGVNPASGVVEIGVLDRNTGTWKTTGIRSNSQSPFIPDRFMDKDVVVTTPSPLNPRVMESKTVKGFNADKLIAAHSNGDPSVRLDTLQDLLSSGATMNPEDIAKLQAYIKRQTNPYQ